MVHLLFSTLKSCGFILNKIYCRNRFLYECSLHSFMHLICLTQDKVSALYSFPYSLFVPQAEAATSERERLLLLKISELQTRFVMTNLNLMLIMPFLCIWKLAIMLYCLAGWTSWLTNWLLKSWNTSKWVGSKAIFSLSLS